MKIIIDLDKFLDTEDIINEKKISLLIKSKKNKERH